MEYYSAVKKKSHLEVCNKWTELESHSERGIPDPEGQTQYVLTHKQMIDIKHSTTPKNLDNKEDPKRDIHGSA